MKLGLANRGRQSFSGIHPVKMAKSGVAIPPHVALKNRPVSLAQVYNHQSVDDIGKLPIKIEADQFAAQLVILLDQNRQAFAVLFDIRDWLRQFVEIA